MQTTRLSWSTSPLQIWTLPLAPCKTSNGQAIPTYCLMQNRPKNDDMHRKNVKSAKLEDQLSQISANGKVLDRVTSHISGLIAWLRPYHRALQFYQQWRRSETWRPKRLRKQLIEALKLSKLNFNDFVLYPLSQYTSKQNYSEFKDAPQVFFFCLTTVTQKWLMLSG